MIFSSAARNACGRIFRRNSAERHDGGAFLADRDRGRRIRHPQRRLPIGPRRKRHREHRGDGIARAGDVAHLDRMGRNMDGLALARHQRHAVLALRHQHGLAVRKLHRVLRGVRDALRRIGAAAGRLRKFLAIGREQRRAAINREIGALGIDDHALAEFARGVDDVADHPRASARPWHSRTAARYRRAATAAGSASISFCSISAAAGCASSQSARSMWVEKCSETKRTFRVVGRSGSQTSTLSIRLSCESCSLQFCARLVLADQADEDAARAERGDVARDIAGAADIGLAALHGNHRRGRFRRNPRHLAIDEFVEHEVADAEHRLAGNRMRQGVKIEHLNLVICCAVSGNDRRDRGNP